MGESQPPAGSLVGQIVAGHELVRVIGAGGMAEVYLARHVGLGMQRAIKIVRADLQGSATTRDRFAREAQVLARLQHNSIVQIVEFGSLPNGWPFLVMEYIDGPRLDQLVEPGPLPLVSALAVLEQMADALACAHAAGIIHRDLKPSNVLVRSGDVRQVKIIDFGLARLLDPDAARLTADGQMIGSPAYMAPEQIEGERDQVTGAADVYALAGIAYTLISGQAPFGGRPYIELIAAHVDEEPPRLSDRCEGVSERLDALLLACLAKDPAARPRSDELAGYLGRIVRGAELARHATRPEAERRDVGPGPATSLVDMLGELRSAPERESLDLAQRIMMLVYEITLQLSFSDPDLTPLLRFESRIREQLELLHRDLAAVEAQLRESTGPHEAELRSERTGLLERIRTLEAQQLPLQHRMVEVAERHRPYASGQVRETFDAIDRLLEQLDARRRGRAN